jgi:PAS domain S-box-containing protein
MNNSINSEYSEIAVLNQLIAIQNVFYILPDAAKKCEFAASALKSVPGVSMCSIYLMETSRSFGDKIDLGSDISANKNTQNPDNSLNSLIESSELLMYPLQTSKSVYGVVTLKIADFKIYEKFKPAIFNFLNIIVINLEIEKQGFEINKYHENLDVILQERTSDLKLEIDNHKKSLQILSESEARYKRLHESMTDCFVQIDMNGFIVDVNRSFCEMIGYTFDELQKLKFTDLTPTKWHKYEQNIIDSQIMVLDNSEVYEKEYIRKDGTIFPVELRTFLLRDNNGLPSGMWALIRDISTRKKNENIRKEDEQRLKDIISNTNAGYFFIDNEGIFRQVNDAWLKMHGYDSGDEIIGKHFSLTQNINEYDKAIENVNKLLSGEAIPIGNFTRLCKDGSVKNHNFSAHPVKKYGKIIGFEGFIIDTTEQKKALDSLKESELKFKNAFEYSAIGMALISLDGKWLKINSKISEILGYTEEELKKLTFQDITYPDDLMQDLENLNLLLTGKIFSYTMEKRYIHKSGNIIWALLAVSLAKDSTDNPLHFISQIKDISERKQSEEIINQNNIKLAELNASKDKFFSIIAHDLKAPFSGFLGITKLMSENINNFSIEELQNLSLKMRDAAGNIYQLLENLLEWSRMQRGTIEFNPEECSIIQIINQNIELVREISVQKNITIENKISDNTIINADIAMLNTIFRNLISNSIKFTHRNGIIEIGNTKQEINNSLTTNGYIEIYLKDTGIGMNNELINKLFKIEEDVSRKGTENEPSTGLGLLLCKEFAEKHNGSIRVESEVGKGSTFYLKLPL